MTTARTHHIYYNNFARGISSDPMVGPHGSYYDSMNMDCEETIGALSYRSLVRTEELPRSAWGSTWSIFFVNTEIGYVRIVGDQTVGSTQWVYGLHETTPLYQLEGTGFAWGFAHKDDRYMIKQNDKITIYNHQHQKQGTITLTGCSESHQPVFLSRFRDTYVACGNKIYVVDTYTINGVFDPQLTVDSDETIIGLHRIGMHIYIVTDTAVYLWQWSTSAPEYIVPSSDRIVGSWVYDGVCYLLCENNNSTSIMVVNGQRLDAIFIDKKWRYSRLWRSIRSWTWWKGGNEMMELSQWIMICRSNGAFILSSMGVWLPVTLKAYHHGITSLHYHNGPLALVGRKSGFSDSILSLDELNSRSYQGYITLHMHTDGVVARKKRASNVSLAYELDSKSRLIVSYRINHDDTHYTIYYTDTDGSFTPPTVGAVYKKGYLTLEITKIEPVTNGTVTHYIMQWQRIGQIDGVVSGEFIKQSWQGPAKLKYDEITHFVPFAVIEGEGINKKTISLNGLEYQTIQLRVDVLTNGGKPIFYDMIYGYERIQHDIG